MAKVTKIKIPRKAQGKSGAENKAPLPQCPMTRFGEIISIKSQNFEKTIGRVRLEYRSDYSASMCVILSVRDGWNDSCPILENRLSLEEVSDLQYLLGRMICAAAGAPIR